MNKREKQLIDREIQLYREAEKQRIDRELITREHANWAQINDAREARRDAEVKELTIIAKLQAKKEALSEIMIVKDNEISFLKELLEKAIAALQTIKTYEQAA